MTNFFGEATDNKDDLSATNYFISNIQPAKGTSHIKCYDGCFEKIQDISLPHTVRSLSF